MFFKVLFFHKKHVFNVFILNVYYIYDKNKGFNNKGWRQRPLLPLDVPKLSSSYCIVLIIDIYIAPLTWFHFLCWMLPLNEFPN